MLGLFVDHCGQAIGLILFSHQFVVDSERVFYFILEKWHFFLIKVRNYKVSVMEMKQDCIISLEDYKMV